MTKDPIAVVQAAVDLTQAAREADSLLTEINEGDKALGDRRLRLGRILLSVRKQFPERGPRAKGWGDFLAARKLEQRTARRYLSLAEHYERHPDESRPIAEVYATFWGKEISDSLSETYPAQVAAPGPQIFAAQQALAPAEKAPPKAQPQSLPSANLPPSTNAVDRWQRFLKGEMTGPEGLDRKRNWTQAHQESDAKIRQEYSAACKAARSSGKTVPPFPPMPGYWLTAGASNDPVQAAAKALSAAEALGREDAARKSPRMIGEVVQRLRQASHLIPSGQDQAVYRAYCEARTAAVSRAAVEDTKTMPLPFEAPAPRPYSAPLFSDGPGAEILGKVEADEEDDADDAEEREDNEADCLACGDLGCKECEEPEAEPIHVRDYLRRDLEDEIAELRGQAEILRQIGDRLRQANGDGPCNPPDLVAALDCLIDAHNETMRECELAAKAHAQALKTMEGMERELKETREGWELAARERDATRAEVAALRAKLEAAEARLTERGQQLHQQRQDGAELLRRAERAEAELRALREGGEPEEEARPVWEVLPAVTETSWEDLGYKWASVAWRPEGCTPEQREDPDWLCEVQLEKHDRQLDDLRTVEREVLIRGARTRIQEQAPSKPAAWQPASIGGAKAVHALPDGASAEDDEKGHPAALCGQRPAYKSKGWTPRPGVALTCDDCRRVAGHR